MSTVQEIDANANLLAAILWQYEQAGNLKSLAFSKQAWFERNHAQFWNSWYRDVFNIDTANSFGLSIWGRILNISLGVELEPQPFKESFGFGSNNKNFNNGNFGRQRSNNQQLGLEQQRMVIRMRYFQLTTRNTIPEINQFLARIFGSYGLAYVYDGLDMTMTYFFGFVPDSQIQFILEKYDLLPRPAGVKVSWQSATVDPFGFGINNRNLNNGNFGA